MSSPDRRENDLILFHNRGVMHAGFGALSPGQIRVFHQCNLAASDDPVGPDEEDIRKWA
jgi:xanthine dioxygenase